MEVQRNKSKRRVSKVTGQNLGTSHCWATKKDGKPCMRCRDPGSEVPYCRVHMKVGDPSLKVVQHPNKAFGKILVAARDLPRGYRMAYWGRRIAWHKCKAHKDWAMSYVQNGGVIDPCGIPQSKLQYMSCPGPSERSNTKATSQCFGTPHDTRLVGREFVLMEGVLKNHQLIQWYGKDWFSARSIVRANVGTSRYPATRRHAKPRPGTFPHVHRRAAGTASSPLPTS